MKILQLIDTLDAGGAERMAVNIANGLAQRPEISSLLCATRRAGVLENELDKNVKFFQLHKKSSFDFIAVLKLITFVKRERVAIIHAHSTSIFFAVITKLCCSSIKVVWHDHYGFSDNLGERKDFLLRIISPFIDKSIAVNSSLKRWASHRLKIKSVSFLSNFSVLKHSCFMSTMLEGVDNKRVICLANLRPQKNHLLLIEAFKKSTENFPEWTLHLVGQDFEDSYSSEIKKMITALSLKNKVFLYGSCEDIRHILSQSNIGVLASKSEGLPLSLLEYANAALPVITTNVGQCAEVVNKNGIVIEDEGELHHALIQYYDMTVTARQKIGADFKERVDYSYSSTHFFEKLLPVYRTLLV